MIDTALEIHVDYVPTQSYLRNKMGFKIVNSVTLRNKGEVGLSRISTNISSELGTINSLKTPIESIDSGKTICFQPELSIDAAKLVQATEQYQDTIKITITDGAKTIAEHSFNITILTFDQWPGLEFPALTACFVTPNHPGIRQIKLRTSQILGK